MAQLINIASKQSGDTLTAGELNGIVDTTNAAIAEQNATKTDHAAAIEANAQGLADKVDKVTGKGLSTEDYTEDEKNKLTGVASGATNDTGTTIKGKLEALEGDARLDASAVKNLPEGGGGGGTSSIVEWVTGEAKPTVVATRLVGDFVEGKSHLVYIITLPDESTTGIVYVQGENAEGFTPPSLDNSIYAMALNTDGSILIGGVFGGHLKKINANGFEDEDFANLIPVLTDDIMIITIASNGSFFIGGYFAGNFKKLNADGSEDLDFLAAMPVIDSDVYAIAINTDGSIVIGGSFTGNLKKLSATGVEDEAFTTAMPVLDGDIDALAINTDGSIIIAGNFTGRLKKLSATGVEDTVFSANIPVLDQVLYELAINTDGSIIIGGYFTGNLKKLSATGVEDTTFLANMPELDSIVDALAIGADGNIFIGGNFTGKLKKLSATGVEDEAFSTAMPVFNDTVNAIAINNDGTIIIGGDFDELIIKLKSTGALYVGYNDYTLPTIANNQYHLITEDMLTELAYTITKPGIYVFLPTSEGIIVAIDGTSMNNGDAVKIHNITEYGMGLSADLINDQIGQDLDTFGKLELIFNNGLWLLHATNYIGQQM